MDRQGYRLQTAKIESKAIKGENNILDVIFWDIDGTLIRTGRAGLYAFQAAASELLDNSVDLGRINAAGMTDYSIAGEIVTAVSGRPATRREIRALTDRYEELLEVHLDQREGKVLPSVREILASLREAGALSLLLTGNSRRGAEIKMRRFGLEEYFDFDRSAFCEDSPIRDEVAGRALRIAETVSRERSARIFVIGDTPHDVRCGKNIGAYTVGVATGTFSLAELENHSPWWAVRELPAAPEFLEKLAGAEPDLL